MSVNSLVCQASFQDLGSVPRNSRLHDLTISFSNIKDLSLDPLQECQHCFEINDHLLSIKLDHFKLIQSLELYTHELLLSLKIPGNVIAHRGK